MSQGIIKAARIVAAALTAFTFSFETLAADSEPGRWSPAQRRANQMESSTWAAGECVKDTDIFSDYEYTYYSMNLLREIGIMQMSGGVREGTVGDLDTQIAQLRDLNRSLNQCRFDRYSRHALERALNSCKGLVHELYALDSEAAFFMKKGWITKYDRMAGAEKLLPAVQACRDKLGKCYNPNSKTQVEWATSLFAAEAFFRDITNQKAALLLDLPPCSRTMLLAGDDKPDLNDMVYVGYANMTYTAKHFWGGTPGSYK